MSICMNCGQRHGGGISCLDLALHQVAALTAQRDRLAALLLRARERLGCGCNPDGTFCGPCRSLANTIDDKALARLTPTAPTNGEGNKP